MVIEVSTPKPTTSLFSWQRIASFTLIFLYLTVLGLYLFMFFYERKTSEELLKTNLALQKTEEELKLEERIKILKQKIDDSYLLIFSHKYPSNIFEFMEKVTHPKVWFSSFEYNSEKREISLKGAAEDFKVLGQQKQILEKAMLDKNIETFNFQDLSFSRGEKEGISFSLKIVFPSDLLLELK